MGKATDLIARGTAAADRVIARLFDFWGMSDDRYRLQELHAVGVPRVFLRALVLVFIAQTQELTTAACQDPECSPITDLYDALSLNDSESRIYWNLLMQAVIESFIFRANPSTASARATWVAGALMGLVTVIDTMALAAMSGKSYIEGYIIFYVVLLVLLDWLQLSGVLYVLAASTTQRGALQARFHALRVATVPVDTLRDLARPVPSDEWGKLQARVEARYWLPTRAIVSLTVGALVSVLLTAYVGDMVGEWMSAFEDTQDSLSSDAAQLNAYLALVEGSLSDAEGGVAQLETALEEYPDEAADIGITADDLQNMAMMINATYEALEMATTYRSLLGDVQHFINACSDAMAPASVTGAVTSVLTAVLSVWALHHGFARDARLLRRGAHPTCRVGAVGVRGQYCPAEVVGFLGLYVSNLVFSCLLISFCMALCVGLCFYEPAYTYVWTNRTTVRGVILAWLVNKIFKDYFIKKFIQTAPHASVRYPALYDALDYVFAFYKVISGLTAALVRCSIVLGYALVAMVRVDDTILDPRLAKFDTGYKAFFAVLVTDERYRNPALQAAAALMLPAYADHRTLTSRVGAIADKGAAARELQEPAAARAARLLALLAANSAQIQPWTAEMPPLAARGKPYEYKTGRGSVLDALSEFQVDSLRTAFSLLDADSTGLVSAPELVVFYRQFGLRVELAEAEAVVEALSVVPKTISYPPFVSRASRKKAALRGWLSSLRSPSSSSSSSSSQDSAELVDVEVVSKDADGNVTETRAGFDFAEWLLFVTRQVVPSPSSSSSSSSSSGDEEPSPELKDLFLRFKRVTAATAAADALQAPLTASDVEGLARDLGVAPLLERVSCEEVVAAMGGGGFAEFAGFLRT